MEKSGAISCAEHAGCLPPSLRFIPVSGPPPSVHFRRRRRGLAPQDGLDRYRLGSRQRIRGEAWSARPPFHLPGPLE